MNGDETASSQLGGEIPPSTEVHGANSEDLCRGGELDEWSNEASAGGDEESILSLDDDVPFFGSSDPNHSTETLPTDEIETSSQAKPHRAKKIEEDVETADTNDIKLIDTSKGLSVAVCYKCCQCGINYDLDDIGPVEGDFPLFGDIKARFICANCYSICNAQSASSASSTSSSSVNKSIFDFPDKRHWAEVGFIALTNLALQADTPDKRTYHHLQSAVARFIYAHYAILCKGYSRNCWKTHLASAMTRLPSHFEHADGQQGRGWWRLTLNATYPTEKEILMPPMLPAVPSSWRRNCRQLSASEELSPVLPSVRAQRKRTASEASLRSPTRGESTDTILITTTEASEASYASSSQASGDSTPRYSVPRSKKRPIARDPQEPKMPKQRAVPSSSASEASIASTKRIDPSSYLISSFRQKSSALEEWLEVEKLGPFAAQYVRERLAILPPEQVTSHAIREQRLSYEAALAISEMGHWTQAPRPLIQPLQTLVHQAHQAQYELPTLSTSFSNDWLHNALPYNAAPFQFPSFIPQQGPPPSPSYRFISQPWPMTRPPLQSDYLGARANYGLPHSFPLSGPYHPYFQ